MHASRIRLAIAGCWLAALTVLAPAARAWGQPGHQLVGSLADELIAGSNAGKQVAALLGPNVKDLKTAAPWLDCVRDVKRQAGGTVKYVPNPQYPSPACAPFTGSIERPKMEDFAARNWTNCKGGATNKPACNREYHFTNVATQHDHYDRQFIGTSEQDIVAAMRAAVGVLRKGPPAAAPFDLKDKREALLLIAHLAGDIHQPLHVGNLYLMPDGTPVDPDAGQPPYDADMNTLGGNRLEVGGNDNLHAVWDDIPDPLKLPALQSGPGKQRRAGLIAAARAVPVTPGPVDAWSVSWATDTIRASHAAYAQLRYTRKGALKPGDWSVQFSDRPAYDAAREQLQRQQLVQAAAHLAKLLQAIWP